MNDMKRLLRYAGPYRRDMVLGAVLVLIETCFELFIPIMIADLIDVGVANHDLSYIYQKGIQMILCALMALITGLLYAHFAARAAYDGAQRFGRRSMRRCSSMHFPTWIISQCPL